MYNLYVIEYSGVAASRWSISELDSIISFNLDIIF